MTLCSAELRCTAPSGMVRVQDCAALRAAVQTGVVPGEYCPVPGEYCAAPSECHCVCGTVLHSADIRCGEAVGSTTEWHLQRSESFVSARDAPSRTPRRATSATPTQPPGRSGNDIYNRSTACPEPDGVYFDVGMSVRYVRRMLAGRGHIQGTRERKRTLLALGAGGSMK